MKHFMIGFEKQAAKSEIFKKMYGAASGKIKNVLKKLTPSKPGIYSNIRDSSAHVKGTTKNVQDLSEGLKKKLEDTVHHAGENIKKSTQNIKDTTESMKSLPDWGKGLGAGALGIYGTSKLLSIPKNRQEYKYYKNQNLAFDKKNNKVKK